MKKELPRLIFIFLIVVGLVVWGLNYIFLSAPKSKATGETVSFIFDPVSVSQSTGDFSVSVKARPSADMTIRGYKFDISFDKDKIQFKSIQYKTGTVSTELGDDDSKKEVINQAGKIKVVGEIQSATGLPILSSQNTEIVTVTFTANSSQSSSITSGGTDAIFSKINSDYTLADILSAGSVSFSVNGGGGVTSTPTSTDTVTLNLQLKFQGITKKPIDSLNSVKVKVKLGGCDLNQPTDYQEATFTSNDSAVWSGNVSFNLASCSNAIVYLKGDHHIQKKICDQKPTETTPGSYNCATGKISLEPGGNDLDFSGIILLSGDLPDQNGVVDAYDTSFIRQNLGTTDTKAIAICDVNKDGVCDTQDYSLVIAALSIKADEL